MIGLKRLATEQFSKERNRITTECAGHVAKLYDIEFALTILIFRYEGLGFAKPLCDFTLGQLM